MFIRLLWFIMSSTQVIWGRFIWASITLGVISGFRDRSEKKKGLRKKMSPWFFQTRENISFWLSFYKKLRNDIVSWPANFFKFFFASIDNHHFPKKNEICRRTVTSMLSNCSEVFDLARIGWSDVLWSEQSLQDPSKNGPRLVTNVWIDWFHIFITQVNTNNVVMWEMLLSNADWDCFKTLSLREVLKIRNPLLEEQCIFGRPHLFPQVGRARNRHQFLTVQQNLKSSLWTRDWD